MNCYFAHYCSKRDLKVSFCNETKSEKGRFSTVISIGKWYTCLDKIICIGYAQTYINKTINIESEKKLIHIDPNSDVVCFV